jgi:hypothetical protein
MHRPKHPSPKPVMVIVDYPIQNEVERDFPWSGASHLSLLSDLAKAGIPQRFIHTTYLSYERPDKDSYDWATDFCKKKGLETKGDFLPLEHQKDLYCSPELTLEVHMLLDEITKVQPKLIIVAGKWSLFFLSGKVSYTATQGSGKSQKPLGGLSKYRASLETSWGGFKLPEHILFPVLPPVTKQRSPDKIPVMQWDCLKAGDLFKGLVEEGKTVASYLEPKQEFILGTELETVTGYMTELLTELDKGSLLVSVDIETRYSSTIDCIGIAYQNNRGICIPFSTLDNPNFWTAEEEYKVFELLLKVLAHENIQVTGQNYAYDAQFIWKFWLTKTEASTDTMILHHVLYNNMEKNLAFLASVYCDNYQYWKDDQQHG